MLIWEQAWIAVPVRSLELYYCLQWSMPAALPPAERLGHAGTEVATLHSWVVPLKQLLCLKETLLRQNIPAYIGASSEYALKKLGMK